jgi:hypothetical protein
MDDVLYRHRPHGGSALAVPPSSFDLPALPLLHRIKGQLPAEQKAECSLAVPPTDTCRELLPVEQRKGQMQDQPPPSSHTHHVLATSGCEGDALADSQHPPSAVYGEQQEAERLTNSTPDITMITSLDQSLLSPQTHTDRVQSGKQGEEPWMQRCQGVYLSGVQSRDFHTPKRIRWTHFLSVPLCSAEDQAAFRKLKKAIFRRAPRTVPETAFGSEAKFHITLCMVRLKASEVDRALGAIRECMPTMQKILQDSGCVVGGRLEVPFEPGLAMFADTDVDDKETRVIFRDLARGSGARFALERIAALYIQSFVATGLPVSPLSAILPLHATVVYVRHAINEKRAMKPVDGRRVLKALSAWPPSTSCTTHLHLSVLGTTAPDGYFQCALKVPVLSEADQTEGPDVAHSLQG